MTLQLQVRAKKLSCSRDNTLCGMNSFVGITRAALEVCLIRTLPRPGLCWKDKQAIHPCAETEWSLVQKDRNPCNLLSVLLKEVILIFFFRSE